MIDLIIGREGGVPKDQARLAVQAAGQTFLFGTKGSVPANVSREHCKITIGDDGKMTVENLNPINLLYINGKEFTRRSGVAMTDNIELGPDKYHLNVPEILKKVPIPKPVLSVKHLKTVYDENVAARKAMKEKGRKMNTMSRIPGLFSMLSLLSTFAFAEQTPTSKTIRIVLYVVAFCAMTAAIILSARTSKKMDEENDRLNDSFREKCVCPNPECDRFLGQQYPSYKEVLKYHVCPFCKTQFKE